MVRTRWLLGLALVGLVVAACGGDDEREAQAFGSTPAADTPTAMAATQTAARGAEASPSPTPLPSPTPTPTPQPRPVPLGRRATEIELPPGFAAFVIAEDFREPTTVALDPKGRVWVTEQGGRALTLRDEDGDGFFESNTVFVVGFTVLSGLAFGPDGVYLSHRGFVARAADEDEDGVADVVHDIISGLPNDRHQNNGIVFGPDGKLYVTNGSTCNECPEADERSATILQANPDGSELRVYARGLRNSYDLVFTPDGRLWATDNGSDPPCNTIDELNLIVEGGDYGWPYQPECDALAKGTPPVADLGFNTSSNGIVYYNAQAFPPAYRGNFFIAQWGANSGDPAIGKRVVRVVLRETPQGPQGEVFDFGLGFTNPLDVAVDQDGSLLVLDWGTGRLYRIVYQDAE